MSADVSLHAEISNCQFVQIGPLRVWFSYRTAIAFQVRGQNAVVSENVWSRTTGKHLAAIDGGVNTEQGKKRVKHEEFERQLNELIQLAFGFDEKLLKLGSRIGAA